MSRRTMGNSLGCLRPGQRVDVLRNSGWLEAEVKDVVDGSVHISFCEEGSIKRKVLHVHDDKLRIPSTICLQHVAVSPLARPSFLAADVTDEMQQIQACSPIKWAMTLVQWNQFITFCKGTQIWQAIKEHQGHVTLYDMSQHFVIPLTRGTGCSVAVLMNKDTQLDATVMISHSWAEDMDECQEAVNRHFDDEGISKDAAVWFCGFGLYQPEDGHGPTIQQQLDLKPDPFTQVISSESVKSSSGRMIAVHTARSDLWERMWCIREVREAMTQGVNIKAALSKEYVDHFQTEYTTMVDNGCTHQDGLDAAGIIVRAARAQCRKEDKPRLLQELTKHGTLADVDKATTNLRANLMHHLVLEAALRAALKGKPQVLVELTALGDLEAVDGLHEVAEAGDEQAQDALFGALRSIARANEDGMMHGWYSLCWKDRKPAFQLVITLLQKMANRQHKSSFDLLVAFEWKPWRSMVEQPPDAGRAQQVRAAQDHPGHGHGDKLEGALDRYNRYRKTYMDSVDVEAWHCQHAKLSLQALAKQGNQRAVDELVTIAKQCEGDAVTGQVALQSLAEQWNRQALNALKPIRDKAWAHKVLETCEGSLCALRSRVEQGSIKPRGAIMK